MLSPPQMPQGQYDFFCYHCSFKFRFTKDEDEQSLIHRHDQYSFRTSHVTCPYCQEKMIYKDFQLLDGNDSASSL